MLFGMRFTLLSALVWTPAVLAHGNLIEPKPRNLQVMDKSNEEKLTINNCPWCGNGNFAHKQGRATGICGDPFENTSSDLSKKFMEVAATYEEGQEINIKLTITTNHGGRMAIRVCPNSWEQATADCFAKKEHHLRRVDNKAAYWYLSDQDGNKEIERNSPFLLESIAKRDVCCNGNT